MPREFRHTFVSLLSSDGTPLGDIADLVGHKGSNTTETVYRKVIVPQLRRGAEVMDRLFGRLQFRLNSSISSMGHRTGDPLLRSHFRAVAGCRLM